MKLVLVVEDEYGCAEVLKLILEAEGYRVLTASNGKVALDLLKGERPALILSDFMMPTMNGGEFGAALRRDPNLAQTPFIFISATNELVIQRYFRDYDAFVPKPIHADTLLQLVARFMEGARSQPPSNEEVDASMRQLFRDIHLPPGT